MDFSIQWMIFHKASHALYFCRDKTKLKLRPFCRRAVAQFSPMILKHGLVEFTDLAKGKLQTLDALTGLVCL